MLCYGEGTMTSSREMSKINKLVRIIEQEEVISKVRLIMQSGISISYYEKLRPFLEELYSYKVQYDKETRVWRSIKNENVINEND